MHTIGNMRDDQSEMTEEISPRKHMLAQTSRIEFMSPRGGNHDYITHDNYFGNTEENKSEATTPEMRVQITPTLSDPDCEYKDAESALVVKADDESSFTTATRTNFVVGDGTKNDIEVIDSLNSKVFTKLSDFSDSLGRKLAFTVDWEYSKRVWDSYHIYVKDIWFEKLVALSLTEDALTAESNNYAIENAQDLIRKKLAAPLEEHTVLLNLLTKNSHKENEDSDESFFKSPFAKRKMTKVEEKGWYLRENLLNLIKSKLVLDCDLISIHGTFKGVLYLIESFTELIVYFRSEATKEQDMKELLILPEDISEVLSKNFLLRPHALELFDKKNNNTYFFNLFSEDKRKEVFLNLKYYGVNIIDNCREYFRDRKFEEKWFKGKISSLDYLMLINKYASRSFNDTSQYPIMPWIGPCGVEELGEIAEQPLVRRDTRRARADTKTKNNPLVSKKDRKLMEMGHIRDLTKISAILNETKAQKADHTYNTGPEPMERDIYGDERYNHKFGYMNSQICLSYLIRIEPYSSLFIIYNGKLDHPDRMLSDSLNTWKKVLSSDQCNSELIPEWFYLPQMFINNNLCFFGSDCKNKVVNHVGLPKWANENPFYYCMKFREFMENPRYSKILHYWIELVFGRKQQSLDDKNIYF